MKVARSVSLGVLLLIPLALAWAQDDPANRRDERRQDRREERTRTTVEARDTTSDKVSQHVISQFATLLAIKNQEEIELSRWAAEKTQNDDVRQFAQKLTEDHTKFLSQLQKFKPVMEVTVLESQDTPASTRATREANRTNRREERRVDQPDVQPNPDEPKPDQPNEGERRENRRERREDANATATDTQTTTRTTVVEGAADQNIHLRVAQEAARRCLEMTKEKLGSKEGQDFDRCYVGGQIVAHVGMIACLQAQQQFASAEFSQLLEQGIQTTQEHLKHAEALAQKLEGGSGGAKEGATPRIREERRKPNEGAANRNREENPKQ